MWFLRNFHKTFFSVVTHLSLQSSVFTQATCCECTKHGSSFPGWITNGNDLLSVRLDNNELTRRIRLMEINVTAIGTAMMMVMMMTKSFIKDSDENLDHQESQDCFAQTLSPRFEWNKKLNEITKPKSRGEGKKQEVGNNRKAKKRWLWRQKHKTQQRTLFCFKTKISEKL